MLKKIVKGLVIGGAALTMAATAQAETYDINIYGASAQFKFWTAAAPEFMADQGCDTTQIFTALDDSYGDRDAGVTVCYGGFGEEGERDGNTYIIRYTTNASYDGIRAAVAAEGYDEDGCGDVGQRKQADLAGATLVPYGTTPEMGDNTALASISCQDVHLGASDVAAETFQQSSIGNLKAHLGGDYETRNVFYPDFLYEYDEDDNFVGDAAVTRLQTLTVHRPIVVPFNFFANRGSSSTDGENFNYDEEAVPFKNMTRLMAVSLFSGKVSNWSEFGLGDDDAVHDIPVTVCMRHAGSGTVATLNAAVMRGEGTLVTTQVVPSIFNPNGKKVYFNKGSSDMMRCVGQNVGGVGYADTDKCKDNCTSKAADYGYVTSMTYMGQKGNADDIKNGKHDFWSAQWMYEAADLDDERVELIENLVLFASDGDNLELCGKDDYWAAQDDMNWEKESDFQYPTVK